MPLVDYLELDGGPHLVAKACSSCGALFLDRRVACGHCGGESFTARRLATTGTLRSFTITHRAAPGIQTPFITGIVDIDGGGIVKANVLEVPPDPAALRMGMAVQLTTFVAGVDGTGTEAVAFAFRPRSTQEA
jgi:uncharacterized OB-fold protein